MLAVFEEATRMGRDWAISFDLIVVDPSFGSFEIRKTGIGDSDNLKAQLK